MIITYTHIFNATQQAVCIHCRTVQLNMKGTYWCIITAITGKRQKETQNNGGYACLVIVPLQVSLNMHYNWCTQKILSPNHHPNWHTWCNGSYHHITIRGEGPGGRGRRKKRKEKRAIYSCSNKQNEMHNVQNVLLHTQGLYMQHSYYDLLQDLYIKHWQHTSNIYCVLSGMHTHILWLWSYIIYFNTCRTYLHNLF